MSSPALRGERGLIRLSAAEAGRQGVCTLCVCFILLLLLLAACAPPQPQAPDLAPYPWLYLRGGEPPAPGEQVAVVIAVGDVMLGRDVAGEAAPLAAVAPWLRAAGLAVGNLECVVGAEGVPRPGPYRLRAPLAALATLRGAGFDVLGLANNHALDYGPEALAETAARLHGAGIDPVGAGANAEAARKAVIRGVNGLRLAFLACNAVPDPDDNPSDSGWAPARWDQEEALAAIAAARAQADAVIVSVHWGYEYELRPDPAQRDAALSLLDAGADLVVGHHPHVVQGTDVLNGRFVAYSLGSLVFDQEQEETREGLALRALFDVEGLRAVQALPLWAGPRPRLMSPGEAAPLLARIQPPPRRIGFACDSDVCHPVDVPQSAQPGLFRAGAIDLTGDGVPEQVQLVGGQVAVYQGGAEVWRGPQEWRVQDLALGDADDDGRSDIMLALLKPDAAGVLQSHPFIVGYRQGAYRVLWGGSAVADPIRELELGDVDGDGVQELVILEERDGARAVTVWRWHGWGFSLAWRSPPGSYRDLALIPGEAGPAISVAVEP
ncbi:MAG TPA: CapA family protein [Anaerolineae bacterium]|nr:CapA family protein [Anaerolineae bacterium]HPL26672.1 CapA family protein [Anaerolineae bacterium]